MATLGDIIVRLGLDAGSFNNEIDKLKNAFKNMKFDMSGASNQLSSMGNMLKGALAFNVADFAFDSLVNGLKDVVAAGWEFSRSMEQNNIALTTLTGSSEQAAETLGILSTMAAKTPYTFNELADSGKRLVAFGFEAKAIPWVMKQIGDATAGLGMSAAHVKGVTMAFGDMIAAGQIYSSDMRQLVSRGIDAWAILASKMGKSVSQIKKMAKDGALESKKSVELILEGMGELFPNMMEEQSKAFDGLASTIKDNMQQISSALSSPIFEIAKGNMGKLAYATGYFLDVLKQTGSRIEAFRATMYLAFGQNGVNAVNLFVFGITKAFEFIQFAISSLVTWWQSLDPSIQNTIMIIGGVIIVGTAVAAVIMGLVSIVSALAAAFSFLWGPIGLIIGAIALLAGAIYWLWTTDEGFRNTMINGWNQIYNTIVSIITNLVPIMQEAWKVIVIIFGAAWENICQIIKTAAIFITNLVQSILTVFDGLLMILSGVFTGNWKKVWDGCGKIFEGAWNSILNLAGLVVNQIIGLINDVIRGINALKNKAALIPGVPKLGDIKTLDTVNWGQSARYNNASGGGENPLSLNIGDLFKNLFKDYTPPKLEVATVDYSKPGDIIRDIAEAGDAQEKAAKQGKKAGNEQAKTLDKVTKEIEKFVDAVQKQAESIINFADLFEKAMLKKFSSTKLLNALKTQLDYLLKWRDALAVLGDRIGTNTALYQTLLKKGPEAAGQIIALSGATDKVLSEYQVAYGQLETIGYDMGYVMAANEQAQNYRNQQIAVNVTGNTISNDYEVDRIADQIIRKLRLQGVY